MPAAFLSIYPAIFVAITFCANVEPRRGSTPFLLSPGFHPGLITLNPFGFYRISLLINNDNSAKKIEISYTNIKGV